ncbi:MAG: M1 family aminopeptidase [Jatrophihabitans sp.]|uniref:M1 family aminopeptidase n=1 Tax=Jatrophihabitans sp. TaxID=1932789 RepID=UPI003F7EC71E
MGGRRPLSTRTHRLAAVGAVLVLGGCTSAVGGHGSAASRSSTSVPSSASSATAPPAAGGSSTPGSVPPSAPSTSSASPPATGTSCSTDAQPDPHRPRMALDFRVADHLHTVDGTERISFTPDRPITELVFRLTANTAPTVAEGNRIDVLSATGDHGAGRPAFTRAGAAASTQGGLLHLPYPRPIAAGTTVSATITFRLTLGTESFDRFGRTVRGGQSFAWFGSGEPLLAWQRGFGWHTEDMIRFTAESATSEAMDLSLRVAAPARYTVLASGNPTTPTTQGADRVWTSTLSAARDVSVAVGPFQVGDADVGGVHLRVGAYSARVRDALVPEFERAIRELTARYGPFPFPSLSVARVPSQGGGVEYPGAIQMLDGSRLVAVHETAHQWFYAMVGNSQALHPYLDEAFAQFSEQLVDGTPEPAEVLQQPGTVDRSTESYGDNVDGYYFVTYDKGAAALEAARQAAGPAAFDAALRCYVAHNAWRIASPADLQAALAHLPAAIRVLRQAGALP